MVGDMHRRGTCMTGGMLEVCMAGGGGMCGRRACVAGETATAADGTHPTGMPSCCQNSSCPIHLIR